MRYLFSTALGVVFLSFSHQSHADDEQKIEKKRIEALIKYVEGLKDAKFVRNGKEYDAETAGKFLRGKWENREKEVHSVDDFIEKVASKSSTSGKAYMIRFNDGREQKSADFLRARVKELDKKK
jgi:hypothetical protein